MKSARVLNSVRSTRFRDEGGSYQTQERREHDNVISDPFDRTLPDVGVWPDIAERGRPEVASPG